MIKLNVVNSNLNKSYEFLSDSNSINIALMQLCTKYRLNKITAIYITNILVEGI